MNNLVGIFDTHAHYDDVKFNEFCEEFPGLSTPFTYSTRDEIVAKTVGGDMESAVSLLNEW